VPGAVPRNVDPATRAARHFRRIWTALSGVTRLDFRLAGVAVGFSPRIDGGTYGARRDPARGGSIQSPVRSHTPTEPEHVPPSPAASSSTVAAVAGGPRLAPAAIAPDEKLDAVFKFSLAQWSPERGISPEGRHQSSHALQFAAIAKKDESTPRVRNQLYESKRRPTPT